MLTPVMAFVALLRGGWHPYTSEEVKRGVGPFVRDCGGKRFFQKIRTKQQGAGTERLGRAPSLPVALLSPSQRIF